MKKLFSFTTIFLILIFLITSGASCTKGGDKAAKDAMKPVTLKYWRVWDDEDAFADLIQAYRVQHPNVNIEYKKFRYEEYEKELLEAFAEDRGPDIFSIHNSWVNEYLPKLSYLPPSVTTPILTVEGTLKKETVAKLSTRKGLSLLTLKNKFLDTVYKDVVWSTNIGTDANEEYVDKIYGLPLSLDTLVMYYNKDLLNNAGIALPPTDWEEFRNAAIKMTKLDEDYNILLSGAALGGAENVDRSFDILSLLMMQNRTQMVNSENKPVFDKVPAGLTVEQLPGLTALMYYTDFANPLMENYAWNSEQENSINSFINGQTAFLFGYSYHLPLIKSKSSKLNFAIAPVPQVDAENYKVNYANYWLETVSKKSDKQNYAWDFIQFIADEKNVEKYLNKTNKPTALKTLINKQIEKEDLTVFVSQLLTAKSWYRGKDANVAEKVFQEMITSVVKNNVLPVEALKFSVEKIEQTMR